MFLKKAQRLGKAKAKVKAADCEWWSVDESAGVIYRYAEDGTIVY